MKRKFYLALILVFALGGTSAFAQDKPATEKKDDMPGMKADGMGGMQRGGMMMQGQGNGDMQTIHALFMAHEKIVRKVTKISNGVETVTESDDPAIQKLIREHVAAMYLRLTKNDVIRGWDPLFAEIFKNADKIQFKLETTAKGSKIVETSDDPWVAKLIQSHAEGVSEFVEQGMPSMHKEHPLPGHNEHPLPGKKLEAKGFLGKGDGVTTCPVTGEPVNKNVSAEIFGRTVYFCCENCRDTVKKTPELYIKPQPR